MSTLNQKSLIFSLIIIIIVVAGVFFFNTSNNWHNDKYSVSVAVSKTPLSSPFYVAKYINAFDDTCVKVNYLEVIGGQLAFEKVINNEVDFGTSSDSLMAFQSLNQHAFVTHAMFVQSDNDTKLISRTADNINSISDLKNKTIGLTTGTSSEYLLSTLLAIEGLSMEDVTIKHVKPEQLMHDFINADLDAILPWEPFAFEAVKQLKEQVKVQDTKSLGTISFNLISKKADDLLIEKATCIIQGLQIAINYIASHPDESKKIIRTELNLAPEFIDWVWPDYIFKLGLNHSLMLNIQAQVKWAMEIQMREAIETPDARSFIDSSALLQVEPGAVNLPQ